MTSAIPLEERVAALSPPKCALLAKRLAAGSIDSNAIPLGTRPRLVAYVTAESNAVTGTEPTADELQAHLESLLPQYMVPMNFEVLDSFPRLPNGKVDVAALQAILSASTLQDNTWIEPRNPTEQVLAEIWCEALQLDSVSVRDNFFELGGDSILSIVVVSKMTQQGIPISPNELFNFPTIAQLAERCRKLESENTKDSDRRADAGSTGNLSERMSEFDEKHDSEMEADEDRLPFFMVHGGYRVASQLREVLNHDRPLYIFNGDWDHADLDREATVEQLAKVNLRELRSLRPIGPYLLGGYSMGGLVALEMAHRLRDEGETVQLLCLIEPPLLTEAFKLNATKSHDDSPAGLSDSFLPAPHFKRAITRQMDELSVLSKRDVFRYIVTEFGQQLRYRLYWPLRNRFKMGLCYFYRKTGMEIPPSLRRFYVGKVYGSAWKNYKLRPYSGNMVLFRGKASRGRSDNEFWAKLAEDGLRVEWFEGKHVEFQNDPELMRNWTTRLAKLLADHQKIQATNAQDGKY